MISIATIVEGDGEVRALPVLLRRICAWQTPGLQADILTPIRVRRDRFLNRDEEFIRVLGLAAAKSGDGGWILIVLDSDDDCPAHLATAICQRAASKFPHRRISAVLANREYEAWFIAAAPSLNGKRGFNFPADNLGANAESFRDAKGWMRLHMTSNTYGATTDQPAFSASIDLQMAFDNSRSFRKLCSELLKLAD